AAQWRGAACPLTARGASQFGTITSDTFNALSGSATGWSPTTAQTGTDPKTVTYTWTAGAVETSTAVTSHNSVGSDSTARLIRFRPDSTAPTVAFLNPGDYAFPIRVDPSFVVHFSAAD